MAMTVSTVVQRYLMGDYPTSRDELVDRARRHRADQAIMSLVRNLQKEQFTSAADVERALGEEH